MPATAPLPLTELIQIARQFCPRGQVSEVRLLGHGNINDTYLVGLSGGADPYFVLQRLNTVVFRQPQGVMQNILRVTEHVGQRAEQRALGRRWQVPSVLLTLQGESLWCDGISYWRGISYVENAVAYEALQSSQHAYEVGYGLGLFHQLVSDLPADRLSDTLTGFHITPEYLRQYETVISKTLSSKAPTLSPEVELCRRLVGDRAAQSHQLEAAKHQGKLPLRIMHGDPKVNNILLDADTHQAVSLIDLDTVKPGLIHYDIGDCLRSGCNRAGEETGDWEAVTFDLNLGEAILRGYLAAARACLQPVEYDYLYAAVWTLTFELGLRFLTDHLQGDRYFKTTYDGHNLVRALTQFRLLESLEQQAPRFHQLVSALRG